MKKKKGGSILSRSKTVTIRLDPRLHYLAGIGARRQRRTLSSFIEWAVEHSLKSVPMVLKYQDELNLDDVSNDLWSADENERFSCLAENYPELLSYEEQVAWLLILKDREENKE